MVRKKHGSTSYIVKARNETVGMNHDGWLPPDFGGVWGLGTAGKESRKVPPSDANGRLTG